MPKMGFEHRAEQPALLGDLLWDVHAAGSKIIEFTTGHSFEEFAESDLLRAVVEKMLVIMAEALSLIERGFPEQFAKLSGAEKIIEVRGPASLEKVWSAAERVPELVAEVRGQLEDWHG